MRNVIDRVNATSSATKRELFELEELATVSSTPGAGSGDDGQTPGGATVDQSTNATTPQDSGGASSVFDDGPYTTTFPNKIGHGTILGRLFRTLRVPTKILLGPGCQI